MLTAPAGADAPSKQTRQKPSAQHDRLHNVRPTLKPLTGVVASATHVRELLVLVALRILFDSEHWCCLPGRIGVAKPSSTRDAQPDSHPRRVVFFVTG